MTARRIARSVATVAAMGGMTPGMVSGALGQAPGWALAADGTPPVDSFTPGDAIDLAERLGDASWEKRDEAERALLAYPLPCLGEIEGLLARPGLSAEHRQRLLNVCRRRFVIEPRAALGVSFGGVDERGVVIEVAMSNFDAFRVLKSGDIILAMDEDAIRSQDQLRAAIISRDPGDVVTIRLLRGEELLAVDARLGAFADLPDRRGIDPATLSMAWECRQRRLGAGAAPEPLVENGLAPERWLHAAREGAAANAAAVRRHGWADESAIGVSVGGEARGGGWPGAGAAASDPRIVVFNGDEGRGVRGGRAAASVPAADLLAEIRGQITAVEALLVSRHTLLERQGLTDQERRQVQQTIDGLTQTLRELRATEQMIAGRPRGGR